MVNWSVIQKYIENALTSFLLKQRASILKHVV